MLKTHARRDAPRRPVLDALNAAGLLPAKQFHDLRRTAKVLDQISIGMLSVHAG